MDSLLKYWFKDCKAIDYELTHQLLLEKLCHKTSFVKALTGQYELEVIGVEREPERGKFDLKITLQSGQHIWVEIKMWSGLSQDQYKKQTEFIKGRPGDRGVYILLGSAWIEKTLKDMKDDPVSWISYIELEEALNQIGSLAVYESAIWEIALIYKESLRYQYDWIVRQYRELQQHPSHMAYYSYFQRLRECLPDIRTGIYTERMGKSQYIMNALDSWNRVELEEGTGQVYIEIIDHEITIRFAHESGDMKGIRNRLIEHYLPLIRQISPEAHSSGRASRYMRIVRMDLDYHPEKVEENAKLFRRWLECILNNPIKG